MTLDRQSPCKVNLLLNILGKRDDGFHELETIMHPVALHDSLSFSPSDHGIELTCNLPQLPTDSSNLVHRAASAFLHDAGIRQGVRIHLEKRIPLAAGLGGGSGNAAVTLSALNELFDRPLPPIRLRNLAVELGSDVAFFLQSKPALGTGRGENIQPLDFFPALRGAVFLLIHPGFGISTSWAYSQLARFPAALNGRHGRAQELVMLLRGSDLNAAGAHLHNSLEPAALEKFPLLAIFQEFLKKQGAAGALMTGSGSTTFALLRDRGEGDAMLEKFKSNFGDTYWTAIVPVEG